MLSGLVSPQDALSPVCSSKGGPPLKSHAPGAGTALSPPVRQMKKVEITQQLDFCAHAWPASFLSDMLRLDNPLQCCGSVVHATHLALGAGAGLSWGLDGILTGWPFEGPSNSPELSLLSFCPPPSPDRPPDEWGQHPAHPAQSPRAIFVILFSAVCRQVRSIGQFRFSEVTTGHPPSPHGLVQALSAPHSASPTRSLCLPSLHDPPAE